MDDDDDYHPLSQYTLDKIHDLVLSFESFIRNKEGSKINERLALGALNDIHKLTEKLFERGGSNAVDIIEQLDEVDDLLRKLNKRNIVSYDTIRTTTMTETLLNSDTIRCPITLKSLQDIITNVRDIEKTFAFQHKLWLEKNKIAKVLDCSVEQLTYGSSSINLWMKLVNSIAWKEAIFTSTPIDENDNPKVIVFGSSQGLLSFYSSALNYNFHKNNITVIGYEILPYLYNKATDLLHEHWQLHCHIGNDVMFFNEDMMTADIKDANIIILTSLCWDKRTRQRVAKKISNELKKPGSIVIDYRDDTFKIIGLDYNYYQQDNDTNDDNDNDDRDNRDNRDREQLTANIIKKMSIDNMKKALFNALCTIDRAIDDNNDPQVSSRCSRCRRFKLIDIVAGPASWNSNQSLYIYC